MAAGFFVPCPVRCYGGVSLLRRPSARSVGAGESSCWEGPVPEVAGAPSHGQEPLNRNDMNDQIPALWLIYRRVSTAKQDASIEAQEAMCAAYCTRFGGPDPEAFEDLDTSGGTPFGKRPGGKALLDRLEAIAKSGSRANVVVSKLDRLGRDTVDVIGTIRRVWELGHLPHLIEGGLFLKNAHNEFSLEVRAAAAQLERNMIRDRITTVLRHKRAQNRVVGTVPFGWRAVEADEGRVLEEDEPQQQILRWMIRQRAPKKPFHTITALSGPGWGYERIATWLNKHEYRSRLPHGGWNPGMIHSVLNNRYTAELAANLEAQSVPSAA